MQFSISSFSLKFVVFNEKYNGRDKIIPHYWLPKWSGDIVEPSARILSVYSEEKKINNIELE